MNKKKKPVLLWILLILVALFIIFLLLPDDDSSDETGSAASAVESSIVPGSGSTASADSSGKGSDEQNHIAVLGGVSGKNTRTYDWTPVDYAALGLPSDYSEADLAEVEVVRSDYTPDRKKSRWTVLVYLCGTDLESEGGAASLNLQEMIAADSDPDVRVVIQTGGTQEWQTNGIKNNRNERFEVRNGKLQLLSSEKARPMYDSRTLTDFLSYAKTNYPADNTMLVLWNHGGGSLYGICFDEGMDQGLSLKDISSALRDSGLHLSIFSADACLMAGLELMDAVSDYADYAVLSEELEPGAGWWYTAFLNYMSRFPSASPADVARVICDSFYDKCSADGQEDNATLSVVDLSKIGDVCRGFYRYSGDLLKLTQDVTSFSDVSSGARRSENYGGNNSRDGYYNMVDLWDLMANTTSSLPGPAAIVQTAVDDAVLYQVHGDARSRAHGISIVYPLGDVEGIAKTYREISDNEAYAGYLSILEGGWNENDAASSWTSIFDSFLDSDEDSGYWDSYFSEDEDYSTYTNITPITSSSYSISYDSYIDNDNYFCLDFKSGFDAVTDVWCVLGWYDEEEDAFMMLGEDRDVNWIEDTDGVYDNFQGTWLSIDDVMVSCEITEANDDYILYSIPAQVNGKDKTILAMYEYETEKYTILSMTSPDSNSLAASRTEELPKPGDKVTFLAYAFTEDDEELEYELGTITWSKNTAMTDADLWDGLYMYMFEIVDIFGESDFTDPVTWEVKGGEIFYVEE